jgi:ferredoxin
MCPTSRALKIAMHTAVKSEKQLTDKMKVPIVELSECIMCGVCVETCPRVFRLNDAGYIEVIELADYPEADVNDAIKYCPVDCIHWES